MYRDRTIAVILAAAGSGTRMGGRVPKQYQLIEGIPMLIRTLVRFRDHGAFDVFCVVADRDNLALAKEMADRAGLPDALVVEGGAQRHESVYRGLLALPPEVEYVVIHDAARPFVSEKIIDDTLEQVLSYNAVVVGVPPKDSVLTLRAPADSLRAPSGLSPETTDIPPSCDGDWAAAYLNRQELIQVQTPQAFRRELYLAAMEQAIESGSFGTDDGSLILQIGTPLRVIPGSYENIKITTREDRKMETRIGNGFDVHRLVPERRLILGGVEIPHETGLLGHSDADVLTHAVMDALLGAAGLGDIGQHFPDSDDAYRNISSLLLLKRVEALLREEGWTVENIDATLLCQRPKLAGYRKRMEENLAEALFIDPERVSVKATTTEKLGFVGREEGIACSAVCLLHG